jgi:AcrR family transcriptional regulator
MSRTTRLRGERRREALIQAGTELLAERGWAALTSRAIAERADAPPGLVHYHFGDLPTLKRDIAAAAVADAFEPALAVLTTHSDWGAGLADAARATSQMTPEQSRVNAELIAAAMHDAQVAALMQAALADARARLVTWLTAQAAAEPEGLATLIVALLDGLVLHRIIDPGLDVHAVIPAAEALTREQGDERPGQQH